MRAVEGQPPPSAQNGLKDTFKAQRYFLACMCKPDQDLGIELPDQSSLVFPSELLAKDPLSPVITRLRLTIPSGFEYHSGQFINVFGPNLIRTYSLASVPGADDFLELHIQHVEGGHMSEWIAESLQIGDPINISSALGQCFYINGKADQAMLLVGTGSGLAPLIGIARAALHHGHTGVIHLYHGSRSHDGVYLQDNLHALAQQYGNFFYHPCLSGETVSGYLHGRAIDRAMQDLPELKGQRIFLCGHPAMVHDGKRRIFLAGASLSDIYADPFEFVKSP